MEINHPAIKIGVERNSSGLNVPTIGFPMDLRQKLWLAMAAFYHWIAIAPRSRWLTRESASRWPSSAMAAMAPSHGSPENLSQAIGGWVKIQGPQGTTDFSVYIYYVYY